MPLWCPKCGVRVKNKAAQARHCSVSAVKPTLKTALIPVTKGVGISHSDFRPATVRSTPLEGPTCLPPGGITRQHYMALLNRAAPHVRFANSPFRIRQAVLDRARETGSPVDLLFAPSKNSQSGKRLEEKQPDVITAMEWVTILAAIGVVAYLWRHAKTPQVTV